MLYEESHDLVINIRNFGKGHCKNTTTLSDCGSLILNMFFIDFSIKINNLTYAGGEGNR